MREKLDSQSIYVTLLSDKRENFTIVREKEKRSLCPAAHTSFTLALFPFTECRKKKREGEKTQAR